MAFSAAVQSAEEIRVPNLGKYIKLNHYFIGVAPIGGMFVGESGFKFSVIADSGQFLFNDEYLVNAIEAAYLLPLFEKLELESKVKPPRNTLKIIIANLRKYVSS